jgi:hypothetical protein
VRVDIQSRANGTVSSGIIVVVIASSPVPSPAAAAAAAAATPVDTLRPAVGARCRQLPLCANSEATDNGWQFFHGSSAARG